MRLAMCRQLAALAWLLGSQVGSLLAFPTSGAGGLGCIHAVARGEEGYTSYRRALHGFDQSAVNSLDLDAVQADIKALLTDSQEWWPADFGNYGPLFIRLAWHCAGPYRVSDGRGGCDGAHIRFDPERSWQDNTNLDKARQLLWPIKQKYGPSLSWGDLIILAGTTAIKSMGGPVLGFCAGRIDDANGDATLELGPGPEQEAVAPCPVDGDCQSPFGAYVKGLIYVDPAGPMGVADPAKSAIEIRDAFGRMSMSDEETVALIGGGHAFGKMHGACPTGPGPSPKEDPANPWPGTCGEGDMKGKGNNTYTSGFDGPWVTTPTTWSNEYFTNLLSFEWELHNSPAGLHQFRPKAVEGAMTPEIFMLVSDIALIHDDRYMELVVKFASDQSALEDAFSKVWYKLTTRDMGPVTRCLGSKVPPPQPFQLPLPPPPAKLPEWKAVRADIVKSMWTPSEALEGDMVGGKPYVGAYFIWLAETCAGTYRDTDHYGGCNGARIRFEPLLSAHPGADKVLAHLEPIKKKYGSSLTWADLIVFAGTVALEESSTLDLKFCPGRSDAEDGSNVFIPPPMKYANAIVGAYDRMRIAGITPADYVAMLSLPRSASLAKSHGYSGTWSDLPNKMTNNYYDVLLNNYWQKLDTDTGKEEYSNGDGLYMTVPDLVIRWDPELLAIAQDFASDKTSYRKAVASIWTQLMNADRFKGPAKNVCD